MINWNTVPAFYNDSYTYMEWLGKVTAKVEDHEARLTQAEEDIDSLEERMDEAEADIDVLEGRMDTAEADIDALEGRMDTAEADIDALEGRMDTAEADIDVLEGRMDTAEADIDALEGRMDTAEDDISDLENIVAPLVQNTIPTMEEKISENTANIITIQREGASIFQDLTAIASMAVTGSRLNITLPYERLTPNETAIDLSLIFSFIYNNTLYFIYTRDFTGIPGNQVRHTVSKNVSIDYTVRVEDNATIIASIATVTINGTIANISNITPSNVIQAYAVLYRAKTITPTAEKEAYQASVRIFTDKTIPIDNRTASFILQYYTAASTDPDLTWADWAADYNTEHPEGLQLDTTADPDTNKDGKINAVDATNIMTYYNNVSAGRTQYVNSDADKFYQWYLDGNPPVWEY